MDKIPAIILVPMVDSYLKGAMPIAVAYAKGGWAEVAKLYSMPPNSTEQLLHPDSKLYPSRDWPQTATLPKQAGSLVESNVVGELGWRVYLEQWGDAKAVDNAAGWDGDRFAVWRNKDGSLVGLIATAWDSEDDAKAFEAAYRASLVARFGGDGSKRADGRAVNVMRQGMNVFILDGSADAAVLKALTSVKFKEIAHK
jgi:heme-degrading monooxygenase HmoA